MSAVKLYEIELLNSPGVFSPNTAKVRYALNLKKIPFEVEWLNFNNIKTVIPTVTKDTTKRPLVPVIVDHSHDDKVVEDSWDILTYLEEAYPDSPSLFNGEIGLHRFFQFYCDQHILQTIYQMAIVDICRLSGPADVQAWFRQDREKGLGMTLEEFSGNEEENIKKLKEGLRPVHRELSLFPFVRGHEAGASDCILASAFVFMCKIRPDLFERAILGAFEDDVFRAWWDRMEPYRA